MIKNLLRLLASSATFVAVMLVANITVAAPQIDNTSILTTARSQSSLVSLNVVSPSLVFDCQPNHFLSDSLGCSCAVCTQGIESTSNNI
ncbi:hypothetical protein I4641_05910 [Waterburya agarophytonicola K14]|uniref:Secreted protein n=1 Tax=Waterburya agarophytonicola KI4 TaxID=2874699 RepID=A0A964BQA5_9CYAN|nr:hypothetical protein [Waterburya agarophytonicola]MCC0176513.1 hypothetical protein [Waterburya agarophytonicola KI4]